MKQKRPTGLYSGIVAGVLVLGLSVAGMIIGQSARSTDTRSQAAGTKMPSMYLTTVQRLDSNLSLFGLRFDGTTVSNGVRPTSFSTVMEVRIKDRTPAAAAEEAPAEIALRDDGEPVILAEKNGLVVSTYISDKAVDITKTSIEKVAEDQFKITVSGTLSNQKNPEGKARWQRNMVVARVGLADNKNKTLVPTLGEYQIKGFLPKAAGSEVVLVSYGNDVWQETTPPFPRPAD
jgi:hypothetical protein